MRHASVLSFPSLLLPLVACSAGEPAGASPQDHNGSPGETSAPLSSPTPGIDLDGLEGDEERSTSFNCGDGILNEDEACDDGNRGAGDGCAADCLEIEPGYICPQSGESCFPFAKCGDGQVEFPEQCDDGNLSDKDGCSADCQLELGWKCGVAGCEKTICGDGVVEGTERCEPSLGPGCTSHCQLAPDCSGSGACTSVCGDGLLLGEECDDGNLLDGDGCDSSCRVEAGYACREEATGGECEKSPDTGECILRVPTTFRDFPDSHNDFNPSCNVEGVTENMVAKTLVDGKPVATQTAENVCVRNLHQWFIDESTPWNDDPTNQPVLHQSELVLYQGSDGVYVNRYGDAGQKWETTNPGTCGTCTPGLYDGSPFFFPLDDALPGSKWNVGGDTQHGWGKADARTQEYGLNELVNDPSGATHNFLFTSEIAYWFAYDANTNATLEFIGDDDVWVFVNGRLALDLGGLHPAVGGSVEINASTAGALGLEVDNVYEIKIFHAERRPKGSTFKLSLAGYETARSLCTSTCGDGIVSAGEQCDAGAAENDGGYNRCNANCQLTSYCGDGVLDEGEQCDDADPAAPANCQGCRVLLVK